MMLSSQHLKNMRRIAQASSSGHSRCYGSVSRLQQGSRNRLVNPLERRTEAPWDARYLSSQQHPSIFLQQRWQSTSNDPPKSEKKDETTESEEKSGTDSLRDTINRLKEGQGGDTTTSTSRLGGGDMFRNFADSWAWAQTEISKAWNDLLGEVMNPKEINKRLRTARPDASATTTEEEDEKYTGSVALMVIDESEHLTAWERMQRRLSEAPLIQSILERSQEIYEHSGAKKAKQKLDDLAEDAREAWETSQNPWVYRVSNVYETVTSLNPESMAIRELQVLDPEFNLDRWHEDLVDYTLPQLMRWFLEGKISLLKPWLGEAVFKRIAAEIAARKKEKVQIDTHVLAILRSNIIAIDPDEVNKGSPIIVLYFVCQQLDCTRSKIDGSIVEGDESKVGNNAYIAAFQREHDEEKGELNWKIVDFRFVGTAKWLLGYTPEAPAADPAEQQQQQQQQQQSQK